jgi:hypothetical protein
MMEGEDNFYTNPFACTLLFYYLFMRSKLNSPDLKKIVAKYRKKPEKLLEDLALKYFYFSVPNSVAYSELTKIISIYQVPLEYSAQIIPFSVDKYQSLNFHEANYRKEFDIYSADFSALECLSHARIIAPSLIAPTLDNMSKAKLVLFSGEGPICCMLYVKKQLHHGNF